MFDENIRSQFQITIKKNANVFEATCSGFPEYTGLGNNEQSAIEDLAVHLADRVGDVVKKTLDQLIQSGTAQAVQKQRDLIDAQFIALKGMGALPKLKANPAQRKKTEALSIPRAAIGSKTGMMLMGFGQNAAAMPSGIERLEDISIAKAAQQYDDLDEEGMVIGIPFSFN